MLTTEVTKASALILTLIRAIYDSKGQFSSESGENLCAR